MVKPYLAFGLLRLGHESDSDWEPVWEERSF